MKKLTREDFDRFEKAKDPAIELGEVLTALMGRLSALNLLDFVLGYDRDADHSVTVYFSKEATEVQMTQLVDEFKNYKDKNDSQITATFKKAEGEENSGWSVVLVSEEKKPVAVSGEVETPVGGEGDDMSDDVKCTGCGQVAPLESYQIRMGKLLEDAKLICPTCSSEFELKAFLLKKASDEDEVARKERSGQGEEKPAAAQKEKEKPAAEGDIVTPEAPAPVESGKEGPEGPTKESLTFKVNRVIDDMFHEKITRAQAEKILTEELSFVSRKTAVLRGPENQQWKISLYNYKDSSRAVLSAGNRFTLDGDAKELAEFFSQLHNKIQTLMTVKESADVSRVFSPVYNKKRLDALRIYIRQLFDGRITADEFSRFVKDVEAVIPDDASSAIPVTESLTPEQEEMKEVIDQCTPEMLFSFLSDEGMYQVEEYCSDHKGLRNLAVAHMVGWLRGGEPDTAMFERLKVLLAQKVTEAKKKLKKSRKLKEGAEAALAVDELELGPFTPEEPVAGEKPLQCAFCKLICCKDSLRDDWYHQIVDDPAGGVTMVICCPKCHANPERKLSEADEGEELPPVKDEEQPPAELPPLEGEIPPPAVPVVNAKQWTGELSAFQAKIFGLHETLGISFEALEELVKKLVNDSIVTLDMNGVTVDTERMREHVLAAIAEPQNEPDKVKTELERFFS